MKILKYTLFAFLISVINFDIVISLSSSFRQDIFELLKKVKVKFSKDQELNSNHSSSNDYEKQEKTITKKSITKDKKNPFQLQSISHKNSPANSTDQNILLNNVKNKLDLKSIENTNEKDTSRSANVNASFNSKDQGFIHITFTPTNA